MGALSSLIFYVMGGWVVVDTSRACFAQLLPLRRSDLLLLEFWECCRYVFLIERVWERLAARWLICLILTCLLKFASLSACLCADSGNPLFCLNRFLTPSSVRFLHAYIHLPSPSNPPPQQL